MFGPLIHGADRCPLDLTLADDKKRSVTPDSSLVQTFLMLVILDLMLIGDVKSKITTDGVCSEDDLSSATERSARGR